nr:MAG TPA: hypothetical protein [Caudoviricetes sp.]
MKTVDVISKVELRKMKLSRAPTKSRRGTVL